MNDRPARYPWLPPAIGIAYGLFYLFAIGDLSIHGPPAWGAYLTDSWLERMLAARSMLMFDAVAMIEAGWLVWLLSPLNLAIAGLLGGLLAANVHGVLYIRAHPASCRAGERGLLAAVPALFAGGACCAPSLILLLGIPGLGAISALFAWLVPVSILLLGLGRVWQRHRGAPPMFRLPWRSRVVARRGPVGDGETGNPVR